MKFPVTSSTTIPANSMRHLGASKKSHATQDASVIGSTAFNVTPLFPKEGSFYNPKKSSKESDASDQLAESGTLTSHAQTNQSDILFGSLLGGVEAKLSTLLNQTETGTPTKFAQSQTSKDDWTPSAVDLGRHYPDAEGPIVTKSNLLNFPSTKSSTGLTQKLATAAKTGSIDVGSDEFAEVLKDGTPSLASVDVTNTLSAQKLVETNSASKVSAAVVLTNLPKVVRVGQPSAWSANGVRQLYKAYGTNHLGFAPQPPIGLVESEPVSGVAANLDLLGHSEHPIEPALLKDETKNKQEQHLGRNFSQMAAANERSTRQVENTLAHVSDVPIPSAAAQIVENIRNAVVELQKQKQANAVGVVLTSLKVVLQPEGLGDVVVMLKSVEGRLQVEIAAKLDSTRQHLEHDVQQLADGLASADKNFKNVDISFSSPNQKLEQDLGNQSFRQGDDRQPAGQNMLNFAANGDQNANRQSAGTSHKAGRSPQGRVRTSLDANPPVVPSDGIYL